MKNVFTCIDFYKDAYLCFSEFFKAGNLEAAVNAYTHAIRLNTSMYSYPLQVLLSKIRLLITELMFNSIYSSLNVTQAVWLST